MGPELNPHYDRPVFVWAVAVGICLFVAGLVGVLGVVVLRATSRPTDRPRKEHPEVARLLEDMRASRDRRAGAMFRALVPDYLEDGRVLVCPNVEREMREGYWPDRGAASYHVADDTAYCYVSGLRENDPFDSVLAFDEEWNHDAEGVNVLYTGGHLKWVTDPEAVREAAARQSGRSANGRRAAPHGRGVAVIRPWWSRAPEPPPFFRLPEETEEEAEEERRAWPPVALAALFAGGALILAWYRRRRRSRRAALAAEREREERRKRREEERRRPPGRRRVTI